MTLIPDDDLDGCAIDFTKGPIMSDEDSLAVVMFADVFHSPVKIEQRRADLIELDVAKQGDADV